jgi:hypothetical protein
MDTQCKEMGTDHCLRVPYEQLVLHPRPWMEKILKYLDLEWTEDVMHHEKMVGKEHGISLSKVERSSDQVRNIYARLFIFDSGCGVGASGLPQHRQNHYHN